MIGRRAFLAAGISGVALLASAPEADAGPAAPLPDVIGCDGWGARPAAGPIPILSRRPRLVLVHHTAGPNTHDLGRAAAAEMARRVQDFHMDRRGWIDSGQNFTVSRGGFVLEGRRQSLWALRGGRRHVVGAHCTGHNEVAVGIENEGTYQRIKPPPAQLDQLRALCAAICARYQIAPTAIHGHRDYRDTDCPGDALYRLLPQLRVDVARLLRVPLSPSRALRPVWPLLRVGDSGDTVALAQWLLRAGGRAEVATDGRFGRAMEASVRGYQSNHRTDEVNGMIGSETWPLLTRDVRVDGSRSSRLVDAVRGRPPDMPGRSLAAQEWQVLLGAVG